MSNPPLNASTGVFGNGSEAAAGVADVAGHLRQKVALPRAAVHDPKRPNESAGSPANAS
jgi:hypothetical protein